MSKLSDASSCSAAPANLTNICNIWNSPPTSALGFPANQLNYLWQMITSAESTSAINYQVDSTTCALNPQLCSLINSNNTPIPNFVTTAGKATTPGILAAKVQAMSAIQWMSHNSNSIANTYLQVDFQTLYNNVASKSITSPACVVDFYNYVMLIQSDNSNNFYAGLSNQTIDMIWSGYLEPFYSYMTQAGNPCPSMNRTVTISAPEGYTVSPAAVSNVYADNFTITANNNDFAFSVNLPLNKIVPSSSGSNQKYFSHNMMVDTTTNPGTWAYTIKINLPTITINNYTLETITVSGITTTPAITSIPAGTLTTPGTFTSGPMSAVPSTTTPMNLAATDFSFGVNLTTLIPTPGSGAKQANYGAAISFDPTAVAYTIDVSPITIQFVNNTVNPITFSGDSSLFSSPASFCTGGICTVPPSATMAAVSINAVASDFIPANVLMNLTVGGQNSLTPRASYTTTLTIPKTGVASFSPSGVANEYSATVTNPTSTSYLVTITDTSKVTPVGPVTAQSIQFINNTLGNVTLVSTLTPFTGTEITPIPDLFTFANGVYTISDKCTQAAPCSAVIPDSTQFGSFISPLGVYGAQNLFLLTDANGNWIYLTIQPGTGILVQSNSSGYTTAPPATNFSYSSSTGNGQYSITIPPSQTAIKEMITFYNNTPYAIGTNIPSTALRNQLIGNLSAYSNGLFPSNKGILNNQMGVTGSIINVQTEFDSTQLTSLGTLELVTVDPSASPVTIDESSGGLITKSDLSTMFKATLPGSGKCTSFACSGTDSVFDYHCICIPASTNVPYDNYIIDIRFKEADNNAVAFTVGTNDLTLSAAQTVFSVYSGAGTIAWSDSNFTFQGANGFLYLVTVPKGSALANPMSLTGSCTTDQCNNGAVSNGRVTIDIDAHSINPAISHANTISSVLTLGGMNGSNSYNYVAASMYCLAKVPVPTLNFINNTPDPIVATIKNQGDIAPVNTEKLVWGTGGYTIAPNCSGTDCSGTIVLDDFEKNDPTFTLVDGSKFTFDVTFNDKSKPTFTNPLEGGYVALGAYDPPSLTYTITISPAQTIALTNTTNELINITGVTDSSAFIDPNNCLIAPANGNPYQIKSGLSSCIVTIGDLDTTELVNFASASGTTNFNFILNFNGTATPLASENNVDVTATYAANAYVVDIKPNAQTIAFTNTTGETINIMGALAQTAFTDPNSCLIAPAGTTPYQIKTGINNCVVSIGDLAITNGPISFTSASGTTAFNFSVNFNGTALPPTTESNVDVTASYSSGSYVVNVSSVAPVTGPTISFTNTTSEAINITNALGRRALINTNNCLTEPGNGNPYQIPVGATNCVVGIGNINLTSPVSFTSASGTTAFNFTVNFNGTASPPTTESGVDVTASYSSNAYVINVGGETPPVTGPTISFTNTTGEAINITNALGRRALINTNNCLTEPGNGNPYQIPVGATNCVVGIGNINLTSPVSFTSASGTTAFNFTVNFNGTASPPTTESGVDVTASYSSGSYLVNIGEAAPVTAQTIAFTNTTGETINIVGALAQTAFKDSNSCLIAPAGTTPYQIKTGINNCVVSIGDLAITKGPVSFTSASGTTAFNFTVNFNGTASPPTTESNVDVTASYASNSYVVDVKSVAPVNVTQMLQIVNNTDYTFNTSLMDKGALIDPNSCLTPPSGQTGYTIAPTKTCSVTIGDLFTTSGDNPFTLFFQVGTPGQPGYQERLLFTATLLNTSPYINVVQTPLVNPNFVGSGSYHDNTYTITLDPPKITFDNQTIYPLVMTYPTPSAPSPMISTQGGFGLNTAGNAYTVDPVTAKSGGKGSGTIGWLLDYNYFTLTGTYESGNTFEFKVNLNGTQPIVLSNTSESINFTATFDPPSQTYNVQIIPTTIAFTNTTGEAIYIVGAMDLGAFSDTNSCLIAPAKGNPYQIPIGANNCVVTMGDLDIAAPVTFNSSSKDFSFTVDFDKSATSIVSESYVDVTPSYSSNAYAIDIASASTLKLNFPITAGSLTQMIQDMTVPTNMMYIVGPSINGGQTGFVMNFAEMLSTTPPINPNAKISPANFISPDNCNTTSDSGVFQCMEEGSTITFTVDVGNAGQFAQIEAQPQNGIDPTVPSLLTLANSTFGGAISGNIMISPNSTTIPESILLTSQNLYPGVAGLGFVPPTLASFPTASITPLVQSSVNINEHSVWTGEFDVTLPFAENVPVNILPFFKFDTDSMKSTTQSGATYNMGTIGPRTPKKAEAGNNNFSFIFALPPGAPSASSVTKLAADSAITIGSGSNLIQFNISGALDSAAVSGTICGATIAPGSSFATVDLTSTGTPSIAITGTYSGTISDSLAYADGLTGSVKLIFEK